MTGKENLPPGRLRDMGRKVAVVGGGAAGMMAAVQAAYAGARVTVYERNDRVGKKILSTGNGKCNFSNEDMRAACYYGSGAGYVDGFYKQFGVAETKTFFRELGMRIKDRNGYLYPASEQAATVLDVLRYEMERLGIEICAGCRVTGIDGPENRQRRERLTQARQGRKRLTEVKGLWPVRQTMRDTA